MDIVAEQESCTQSVKKDKTHTFICFLMGVPSFG